MQVQVDNTETKETTNRQTERTNDPANQATKIETKTDIESQAKQQTEQSLIKMQKQFDNLHRISREQPEVSWENRLSRLERLEKLVNDNRDIIAEVINQDFGRRSKSETLMAEIFPTLQEIAYAKKYGKDWMKTKKVSTAIWFLPASSYIQSQPVGVVGVIAPWNYPLYLSLPPIIGALTAGNRVMIKPSEHAPIFANWLTKTLPEYFSEDEVCVVTGDSNLSRAFSTLPFDHLIFTGSTTVGRHVMRSASENLTPVTLELGGKSPVIIDKDSDLDYVVGRVWTGKLLNAGQTCIAPDYVLLPETLQDSFIEKSKKWINKHYADLSNNEDYGHLINQAHFDRVKGYLADAQQHNANIHPMTDIDIGYDSHHHTTDNAINDQTANKDTTNRLMPPFIVTDLQAGTKLLEEEIFAPILPIITYQSLEEAINYVNDRPRPLALYVFSKNDAVCDKVMNQTVSGGACVNDVLYHIAQHELPFGGVGSSGMGHYHGKFSFDTFSHQKAVFRQSAINAMGLLQPPYGKVFDKIMKVLARE